MQLQPAPGHSDGHPSDGHASTALLERTDGALAHPELGLAARVRKMFAQVLIGMYLPSIFQGMAYTFSYMFRKKVTEQYPDKPLKLRPGYRGEHRLKVDAQGNPKCVACFMCQTACPAECITIVAAPAPADWVGRDKRPIRFDIDLLKCIYCGMCEEACPCDAIELTPLHTQVATKREHKLHDIDVLLGRKPPPGRASK